MIEEALSKRIFIKMENEDPTNEESETIEMNNRRKKKFTGGNASKRHRDRVNVEFNNLAKLLPFPETVIAKLDKSSILRLAVSYIRAKSFFKGASVRTLRRETLSSLVKEGTGVITEIFSKALDGFLLVLTEDMKVLFVSESVRDNLGYCQAGIIHESFLQFVNPADHSIVKTNVVYRQRNEKLQDKDNENLEENQGQPPVRRRFVCRMKCAYSCSSRFYTAYRTFQFSGHLRKSTIQEGREHKTINTLVVFATPLSNSNDGNQDNEDSELNDVIFPQAHMSDRKDNYFCYETYTSGFRIEPTLRPHVAPIPVTSKEQTEFRASQELPPSVSIRVNRPPPSLINTSETFPPRELPRLIKREHMSSTMVYPQAKSSYSDLFSHESRCSDHSDDSKYSPVSSPNLTWKEINLNPNYMIVHQDDRLYNKYELNRLYINSSQVLHENDIQRWAQVRKSPELIDNRPGSHDSTNSIDIYPSNGTQIRMRRNSIPVYTHLPENIRRKRTYTDDYAYYREMQHKRSKFETEKKKKFDISSLLGLED